MKSITNLNEQADRLQQRYEKYILVFCKKHESKQAASKALGQCESYISTALMPGRKNFNAIRKLANEIARK